MKEALDANANLSEKLFSANDSVKQITLLRERLDQRDQTISQYQTSINDLKGAVYDADQRTDKVQTELQSRVK